MLIPSSENRLGFFVLIYIGLSFFSYPFIAIKYIHLFSFVLLSFLILGAVFLALISNAKHKIYFNLNLNNPSLVNATLLSYILFLCIFTYSSLLAGSILELSKVGLRMFFLCLALFLCPYFWLMKTLTFYSLLVGILSIGALALFCLQFIFDIEPLGYVTLDYAGEDSQDRGFYLTGLFWDKAYVKFEDGMSFFRSQSFADEPGTYAFSILPALLYCLYSKRFIFAVLLSFALLTTLSIGAFITGFFYCSLFL